MCTISIIVPIYNNKESYLRKCIESILSQTYKDYELLLINDGAKDNSPRICEEYSRIDARIKIINKTNGGISSARNKGIRESKGSYICFIDHDDWVESNYLEVFINNIRDNDLIITNFKSVYSSGIVNNKKFEFEALQREYFIPENFEKKDKFVLTELPWNKMFKSEIIRRNIIFFKENIKIGGEDLVFVLDYALHCKKICFINKYTYNYNRLPGVSVTLNYIPNYYNEAKEIKEEIFKIKERYHKIDDEEKRLHYFRVASKAIYEEGKPTNNKTFKQRYNSIKEILNISEIKTFIREDKIIYTESKFFKIIQILMMKNQPLFITLFLTIFFKIKNA